MMTMAVLINPSNPVVPSTSGGKAAALSMFLVLVDLAVIAYLLASLYRRHFVRVRLSKPTLVLLGLGFAAVLLITTPV